MESRKQKHIPIACRYIPHDQWFLTHTDPAWKIKHLKQQILAKSLSLPFDPRRILQRTTSDDRAPSPITFAPDEGQRPVSPIQFANALDLRKKGRTVASGSGAADTHTSPPEGSTGAYVSPDKQDDFDEDDLVGGTTGGVETGYDEDDEWDDDEDDIDDEDDERMPPRISRQSPQPMGGKIEPLTSSTAPVTKAFPKHQPSTAGAPTNTRRKPFNPLAKIAKTVTGSGSQRQPPPPAPPATQDGTQNEDQIDTQFFTLVRFSTGQVLEDELPVTWYDFCSHELLEMHAACPPLNFTVSIHLGAILTGVLSAASNLDEENDGVATGKKGGKHTHSKSALFLDTSMAGLSSTTLNLPHAAASAGSALVAAIMPGSLTPHAQQLQQQLAQSLLHSKHSHLPFSNPAAYFATTCRELTPLPRTDPSAYVQPYWEGWVRSLRVVLRADQQYAHQLAQKGFGYAEYAAGMTNAGGGGVGMAQWDPAMYPFRDPSSASVTSASTVVPGVDERPREQDAHGRDIPLRSLAAGDYHRAEYEWHGFDDVPTDTYVHGRTGYGHGYRRAGYPGDGQSKEAKDKKEKEKQRERDREREKAYGKTRSTLEWRDRWLVVRDGVMLLYKDRNDPNPSHRQALSDLVSLRDAEHLAHSVNSKKEKERERERLRERDAVRSRGLPPSRTGDFDRARQQHHQHRRRSTSTPRASTSTARDLRSQRSTAMGSYNSRTFDAGQMDDKELQKALEKENERRRLKEKHERELEALRRWDDLGLSFNFGKGKGKDKNASGKSGKEKQRDEDRANDFDSRRMNSLDGPREKDGGEKDRERTRTREKGKGRQQERDQNQKDPRTFIPTSRDDADAAGMKIVCAKFRIVPEPRRPIQKPTAPRNDPTQLRYTSTGPSLAGEQNAQFDSDGHESLGGGTVGGRGQGRREDSVESYHRYRPGYGLVTSPPTRKSSLPGLGLSAGKLAVPSTVSTASLASSGVASNLTRAETSTMGSNAGPSNKFSGLFGKDRESGDDYGGRKEKEERKREEKERKAREKELKQLDKDKKKDKKPTPQPAVDSSYEMEEFSASGTPEPTPRLPTSIAGSLSTADRSTSLSEDTFSRSSAAVASDRPLPSTPLLTLQPNSPSVNPGVTAETNGQDDAVEGSGSDSSSLSLSSPVFAHSTDEGESDDLDDFGYNISGRDRKGYRYGGYQPPKEKKKILTSSSYGHGTRADMDDARSETGQSLSGRGSVDGVESARDEFEYAKGAEQKGNSQAPEDTRTERTSRTSESDGRGEWLVLDLGNDSSFSSLLRILHRHFPPPVSSTFIPPSLAAAVSSATSLSTNSKQDNSSSSSPMQRTFSPQPSLDHASDRTSLSAKDDWSVTHVGVMGCEADDEDDPSTNVHPQSVSDSKPIHPHVLSSLALVSNQNAASTPALPYPEWRIEMVHRARLLGMREVGRPLAFALNGWGRGFEELAETVGNFRRNRKDSIWGTRAKTSFLESLVLGGGIEVPSDDSSSHEDEEDSMTMALESGAVAQNVRGESDARRMSLASHVSTIKASAASSVQVNKETPMEQLDDDDAQGSSEESDDAGAQTASEGSRTEDADEMDFVDNEYNGKYSYGKDDEDEALAEGLGSFMDDSEDESEVEWLAWVTDLPRQFVVQQQRDEIERLRREKEMREQLDYEQPLPPLSPMKFANPFSADNPSPVSQQPTLPTPLPPLPPPKTQEEERMRFVQKRRKLEPSATSVPTAVGASHQPSSSVSSSSLLHVRTPSRQLSSSQLSGYHAQRFSNPSTLSSPSSSESLGPLRHSSLHGRMTPLNVNAASPSASKLNSVPMSPLGSTFSSNDDHNLDALSSHQSSPGYSFSSSIQHASHSRSISGSGSGIFSPPSAHMRLPEDDEDWESQPHYPLSPRRNTLYHSVSMPLTRRMPTPGASPITTPAPQSPISMSPNMAILTPAQIAQIEIETEDRLKAQVADRLPSSAENGISLSSSPPSSFPQHLATREPAYQSLPRRLSTSSPSPVIPTAGTSSLGRSASVSIKPSQSEKSVAERGFLKRRVDVGNSTNSISQQVSSSSGSRSGRNNNASNRPPQGTTVTVSKGSAGTGSVTTLQTAKALLRRVRSGSSLGHDNRIDELSAHSEVDQAPWNGNGSSHPPASSVIDVSGLDNANRERGSANVLREVPPIQTKKKKGTMDRIVRGLDSALEFVDGR